MAYMEGANEVIYDEDQKPKIANILPMEAALTLSRAYEKARDLPIDSLKRKEIIEEAIEKAKSIAPGCFSRSRPYNQRGR